MKNGMRGACGCGMRGGFRGGMGRAVASLAELPVGASGTIVRVLPGLRGRKKFADVGLVAGTRLQVEAHAPFGGLIRVKFMDTSMALHCDSAAGIMMECGDAAK